MKTLLGYADQISVTAGDEIAFRVSSETAEAYDATIVRIVNGDLNPAGSGYREEEVPGTAWHIQGRPQKIHAGSCIVVDAAVPLDRLADGWSVTLLARPTLPDSSGQDGTGQVMFSLRDRMSGGGMEIGIKGEAGAYVTVQGSQARVTCAAGVPMRRHEWYRLRVAFDAAKGELTLSQAALESCAGIADSADVTVACAVEPAWTSAARIIIAARATAEGETIFGGFYNGKLEAPCLLDHAGAVIGQWDFSIGIDGQDICDQGPFHLHGHTWQMPGRAMTGHNWNGSIRAWQDAPEQYGAIHFHEDDIIDAGWATDFSWQVPAGLKSGLYAARLRSATDEDHIPFVIRRTAGTGHAPLVFVLPTASYLAYANEHLAIDAALAERVHDHVPVFGASDVFLAERREFGASLYDRHSDGSGIMISSRLRPVLNMRPKYQSWLGGTGSGLWQMNADTHIIDWLEHEGFDYDIITDEDLDREGIKALSPYRCVMLASHPEYVSTRMLDALAAHRADGGRLVSLGGNALYWRVVYHPTMPGVMELRRCEVGNGWITDPGESCHAFGGEYGGLWERIGRPPHETLGSGFIGQGFDKCTYFRRQADSYNPRVTFIFDGIEGDIIGDFGLIGGGAAGIELDRANSAKGTPLNTLVLARSEGHTNTYLPSTCALLINYAGQGAAQSDLVRAEIVFFETAEGGAVFSTGSIAWSGSLSHADYDNSVSRMTGNVVRRFIDPAPFELPASAARPVSF
ncbi:N,N-dimethylformamidase beta subunit family domain-containing protein [Komagataeibacter oboediens]|uniref:N,N-dimethylformamidase n=1 Tax=Komagataeibacter oboediens TaxID=65958 RepID=A0ABS5SP30_9PROT|nr:N,N-dimethylformamidase beta subunit family domain-containing protein [Komagataeibacter oboediens]MBL7234114.1 N,N-dimethylformamidase [Komagataeibacter oboediens]MBT0675990.1 N,N-dimethylformamidase [Komagataeibacter oboediens]MBT0679168.1 N,N-dimethylformamidase [Komagataeibacter oboediens]